VGPPMYGMGLGARMAITPTAPHIERSAFNVVGYFSGRSQRCCRMLAVYPVAAIAVRPRPRRRNSCRDVERPDRPVRPPGSRRVNTDSGDICSQVARRSPAERRLGLPLRALDSNHDRVVTAALGSNREKFLAHRMGDSLVP
jgi:hypothetical protein